MKRPRCGRQSPREDPCTTTLPFIALTIVFFVLAGLLTIACDRIIGPTRSRSRSRTSQRGAGGGMSGRETEARRHRSFGIEAGGRSRMSYDNALGLILAVALTAYLVYALVFPEKL